MPRVLFSCGSRETQTWETHVQMVTCHPGYGPLYCDGVMAEEQHLLGILHFLCSLAEIIKPSCDAVICQRKCFLLCCDGLMVNSNITVASVVSSPTAWHPWPLRQKLALSPARGDPGIQGHVASPKWSLSSSLGGGRWSPHKGKRTISAMKGQGAGKVLQHLFSVRHQPFLVSFLFLHKGKNNLPGDVGLRVRTLVDLTLLLFYSVIDLGYIL